MRATLSLVPLLLVLAGCSSSTDQKLTLATTTSVQDTGLLDTLGPMFRDETGIDVHVLSVGSGQALEMGRRGDVDVLLVHDPDNEVRFMEEGHGTLRREVMTNDFVLVGPHGDPAGIRKEESLARALQRLSEQSAVFISRGDESGTHQREKQLWKRAMVEPQGDWYIRAGSGMAAVLRLTNELQGYTLTDRGTFLTQKSNLELSIVFQGGENLVNRYSVLTVNPEKNPAIKSEAARKFAEFLVSPRVQTLISKYGAEKYGQPLFSVRPPAR